MNEYSRMENSLAEVDNMLYQQKEIDEIKAENLNLNDEVKSLKSENDMLKLLFKNRAIFNNSNNSDDSTTINKDINY